MFCWVKKKKSFTQIILFFGIWVNKLTIEQELKDIITIRTRNFVVIVKHYFYKTKYRKKYENNYIFKENKKSQKWYLNYSIQLKKIY